MRTREDGAATEFSGYDNRSKISRYCDAHVYGDEHVGETFSPFTCCHPDPQALETSLKESEKAHKAAMAILDVEVAKKYMKEQIRARAELEKIKRGDMRPLEVPLVIPIQHHPG